MKMVFVIVVDMNVVCAQSTSEATFPPRLTQYENNRELVILTISIRLDDVCFVLALKD